MDTGTTATPSQSGNTDVNAELEKLKAVNAELERKSQGLLNDLKSEREKRQQLEAGKTNPPAPVGNPVVDPVNKLIVETAMPAIQRAIAYEKAKAFVAGKAGVDPDDVEGTEVWKETVAEAQRLGLSGAPDRIAKTAYQLVQQRKEAEKKAKEEAEKQRLAAINGNATVSTSTNAAPTSSGSKTITNKELEKMSLADYANIRDQISKGEIKVVG